ncbi:MAG TPA: hypothetical protein ENN64_00840 [bacterium]|nr:hypothetical protein [bacterium]
MAGLKYDGEIKYRRREVKGSVSVLTAVDIKRNMLVIEPKLKYVREKMPLEMNGERRVLSYGDIIYEADGKPIRISSGTYAETTDGNIAFI